MSAKNKNYDEEFVRESLECAICKDFFDEPKQLVCGHTFCRNCIERLDKVLHVRNDFGDHLYPIHHQFAVQCPQCRDMCIIPPSGLNTNYVVKEMVEKFRDIGVSHNRPSAATSSGGSHSKLSCEACKRQTLHEEMFLCRTCTVGQVDNKKIFLCGFCIVTRGHKDHEIIICTDLAVNQDRQMAMSKVNESEMSVRAVGQRMKGIPLNIFHRLEDLLKQIHKLTKYFDTLRAQCLDAETTLTKQELDSKVKESVTVAEHIGQAYSQLEKLKMENIQSIAAIASSVERYNLLPNTAAESSRNLIDFDSAMPSTSANALATHHVNCFAYSNDAALDVDKRRRAIIRGRNKARRTENVATDENAAAQIQPIVLD